MNEALLQLMNTYQSAGLSDECADTLTTLCQRPTSLMQRYLRSDSYSLLGYALSRTERMDEAEQWTDSALAVSQYQPTPQRVFRKYAYAAAVFLQPEPAGGGHRVLRKRREQGVIFLLGSSFITIILLIILFRRKFRIQELERQALETRLNALIEKVECERSIHPGHRPHQCDAGPLPPP